MWNPFKSKKESYALVPAEELEPAQSIIIPPDKDEESIMPNPTDETKSTVLLNMSYNLANKAMDVYNTSLQVEQNIAAIRAYSDVQLAQITSKFEFCRSALDHVFQDRHSALAAHYCVLNDAMKSNDREMIITALKGISSIVVTSPIFDFKEIVNNWDNYSKKKPLELDF